ncbi:MAG: hypothetical protein QOF71_986 [Candidatus Eremiobacteraeota bacterium]|jgi:hypothetical protein|nr:hypothetical protein [Candidatus Eremiobacteraeota bacterium]
MDMDIPQYCRRCGTMLIDGVCPTCPVPAPAAAPQPHKPVVHAHTATAVAPAAPAAAATAAAPESAEHHQWFSSIPTPAVAARGKGWRYAHMWNWGAFLLCPLWLMSHGRIGRAILFLVLCVVPFFWPFALAMAIAYGIKGNKVASMSRDFVDDAQFVRVQNAWRDCGFGVLLLAVVLFLMASYVNMLSAPRGS